jgi:hypothetical protein
MYLFSILLTFVFLVNTCAYASITIFNEGASYSNQFTKNNSLNRFDTGTLSFFDRDLEQLILVTNLYSPELRVIFLKDNKAISSWRIPNSSLVKPFSINKIDFYPSEKVNGIVKAGSLLINTNRGDIISNLYTKETNFLRYGRELYSGRYKDMPIIEINSVNVIQK